MIARIVPFELRYGIMMACILLLSGGTCQRNPIYRTPVDLWSEAVRESPGKQRTHHNLGCALAKARRYEDALLSFRQALVQDLDGSVQMHFLHIEMGNAFFHLERYDEALASWRRALALSAGNAEVLTNIAVVLFKMGKFTEAESHAEAALASSAPHAETLEVLGDLAFQKREYRTAASYYESAAALRPGLLSAQRSAALAYERAGDLSAARIVIDKYLQHDLDSSAREEAVQILQRIRSAADK